MLLYDTHELTSGGEASAPREYFPDPNVIFRESPVAINFSPKEIIYCLLDFKEDSTSGVKELQIIAKKFQSAIPAGGVEAFARAAVAGQLPAMTALPDLPTAASKPTDIGVTKQCYVVIELAKTANWQFATRIGGISTDGDFHPDNCDLRHVDRTGAIHDANWPNHCRVAYFSMISRKSEESQKFNFHVDMVRGDLNTSTGYAIGIVIDPDIRNTGTPPIPPPAP